MGTRSRFFTSSSPIDLTTPPSRKTSSPCPTCAICIEPVSQFTKATIDSCDHQFCFDCILKWTKVTNSCPLCKRRITRIKQYSRNLPRGFKFVPVSDKQQRVPYDDEDEPPAIGSSQTGFSSDDEYEEDGFIVPDHAPIEYFDEDTFVVDTTTPPVRRRIRTRGGDVDSRYRPPSHATRSRSSATPHRHNITGTTQSNAVVVSPDVVEQMIMSSDEEDDVFVVDTQLVRRRRSLMSERKRDRARRLRVAMSSSDEEE